MSSRYCQFSQKLRKFIVSQFKAQDFWRNSFLLIIANIIVTFLGLVRTPLITWVIPKEQVGMLGVIASWMPYMQLVSLTGLDTASYHYACKGQPWAFFVNITHRLRWSLLSAAGFLAGAIYMALHKETDIAWLFIIAGISYPLTSGLSAVGGTLGALELYSTLFWFRIWESLTDFTGFIPLILSTWFFSQIATFYGANQFATAFMQVGFSAWLLIHLRKAKTAKLSSQDELEMLHYGKHQTAINSISVLNNRLDALLVGLFLSFNTVADYSIALIISEQLRRLWNIYITIRYPKLVRMPQTSRWRQFVLEGLLTFLGFIVAGGMLVLLAHWLVPLLLPPSYTQSLGYIDLLIIGFLCNIPGGMTDTFFRTQQDHKLQYLVRLIGVAIGTVFSLLMLPKWGAYGAAGGKIFSGLAISIAGIILFIQRRPLVNSE